MTCYGARENPLILGNANLPTGGFFAWIYVPEGTNQETLRPGSGQIGDPRILHGRKL